MTTHYNIIYPIITVGKKKVEKNEENEKKRQKVSSYALQENRFGLNVAAASSNTNTFGVLRDLNPSQDPPPSVPSNSKVSGEDLDSDFYDLSRVLQENRLDRQQRYEEKTQVKKRELDLRYEELQEAKRSREALEKLVALQTSSK